jgi:uncharacterized protein YqgC (DUF456 family)
MDVVDIAISVALIVLNGAGVLLTAMSLPGTWLILLATSLAAWWRWDHGLLSGSTLIALAVLAVLGEIVELVAGAVGSKRAGGTAWGAVGALAGSLVGGISGTMILPVIGSVLGAAIGAFAGALLGERIAGRDLPAAAASGRGAFFGRLVGTLSKLLIATSMWILVAFACFL